MTVLLPPGLLDSLPTLAVSWPVLVGGEGEGRLTLRDILGVVCSHVGRRPPRVKLPHDLILPLAYCAEAMARVTAKEPPFTVDGIRMAKKRMFFTCEKAKRSLGYAPRPAALAIRDAVDWFRDKRYFR